MAELVAGVNPKILTWARERAGYSIDEVASAMKKDKQVIASWESGGGSPTYVQLEKMAYQLYKRPIAIFFFPEPPEESDPKQSFRTLPEFEIDKLTADSRLAVRQAMAMQIALRELNDGKNPIERRLFNDIQVSANIDVAELAAKVRNYLGVGLDQQNSWGDTDVALKNWRSIIQRVGIFIFKRSFKQKDISGFCLLDDEFPLIYVNNSTAASRQVFTIFHELSHILLQTNGITKQDDQYIHALTGSAKEIEVFCNQFSAEFLVPSNHFDRRLHRDAWGDEDIATAASRYKVSREVILRKLLDRQIVSQQFYDRKIQQWIKEFEESNRGKGGGNYYATQATYLGDRYLDLAFGKYYQGRCTVEQLADYLNVRVKSVAGLEQIVLRKTQ